MLRHQTIALALFLSAGCEVAGPPAPEKPAPAVHATPAPAPAPGARVEPNGQEQLPQRPPSMLRSGPKWGSERPRFKLATPAATTTPPAATPSKAP
jgi:hypothetical protein